MIIVMAPHSTEDELKNVIDKIEEKVFDEIQSKIIEIFLNYGKVVIYGIKCAFKNIKDSTRLFYAKDEIEALKCFSI